MILSRPALKKLVNSTGYALRNGIFGLRIRSKVKSTSSALKSRVGLNQGVVWNFTPRRRSNVYTRLSSETSQRSARLGSILFMLSRLYSSSRLNNVVATV